MPEQFGKFDPGTANFASGGAESGEKSDRITRIPKLRVKFIDVAR